MGTDAVEVIANSLKQSEGLVLVVGPTGAGKTMTMYSLVNMIRSETKIAVSVEDPVEFDLPHVRQLEVDDANGLTMNSGLNTILRMILISLWSERYEINNLLILHSGQRLLGTLSFPQSIRETQPQRLRL